MAKICQNLLVWFGRPIFNTFLVVSLDPVHIFQNRFLRWNRVLKPVDLSTMNPINKTIFFKSYKGGCRFLKLRTPQLKPLKMENDIRFPKTYMIYHNNHYQPIWKWDFFNFQPTLLGMSHGHLHNVCRVYWSSKSGQQINIFRFFIGHLGKCADQYTKQNI